MQEIASAVTDILISVETACFAWLLHTGADRTDQLKRCLVLFFAAVSLSAFLGGLLHGFYPDPLTAGHQILWPLILISTGLTAVGGWAVGTALLGSPRVLRIVMALAIVEFLVFVAVILFISDKFLIAIANYLPAAVFVLVAFAWTWFRTRARFALYGVAGMLLMFAAAGLQTAKVGIHPAYFDHNSVYHVIHGIAIALVFMTGRGGPEPTAAAQA